MLEFVPTHYDLGDALEQAVQERCSAFVGLEEVAPVFRSLALRRLSVGCTRLTLLSALFWLPCHVSHLCRWLEATRVWVYAGCVVVNEVQLPRGDAQAVQRPATSGESPASGVLVHGRTPYQQRSRPCAQAADSPTCRLRLSAEDSWMRCRWLETDITQTGVRQQSGPAAHHVKPWNHPHNHPTIAFIARQRTSHITHTNTNTCRCIFCLLESVKQESVHPYAPPPGRGGDGAACYLRRASFHDQSLQERAISFVNLLQKQAKMQSSPSSARAVAANPGPQRSRGWNPGECQSLSLLWPQ
jgi:hypothetical protein